MSMTNLNEKKKIKPQYRNNSQIQVSKKVFMVLVTINFIFVEEAVVNVAMDFLPVGVTDVLQAMIMAVDVKINVVSLENREEVGYEFFGVTMERNAPNCMVSYIYLPFCG